MKHSVLSLLLLALGCVHIHSAPVEQAAVEQGSCEDPSALGAARLALTKINKDRTEGYIFSMHRLSNVHTTKHGENGIIFYLTLDVVETNCSVLNTKEDKICEARETGDMPVYGQCKSAIFINKVQRVVRLYKYDCVVRPVPAARVNEVCPDCPFLISVDNEKIQKTVSLTLDEFNKKSGLANRFALLKVNRASTGMAMSMYYNVEYTIQETTCLMSTEAVTADKCPPMECEFAHKGFCKASLFYNPSGEAQTSVECEIYEPEAAEREKKLHLQAGGTDHSHNDTNTHNHDQAHAVDQTHTHDHMHDHTKSHAHHNKNHHHAHDHGTGSSHAHSHGHDHVHAHHAKAHDHTGDSPSHHHNYKHPDGVHTHEHDHELALDHDHKHAHIHEHEHHHHHHDHDHESTAHDHILGRQVTVLPAMDQPMTMPSSPDVPAGGPEAGVTLPLKPDPQIPGEMEPTIQAFPTTVSAQCPVPVAGPTLVEKLFTEDPMFKPAA